MITITVGNEELGNVLYDRSDTETPRTLQFALASAPRIIEEIPAGGVTLPPRMKDHGKGIAVFQARTERNFDTPGEAALWILDLADERGFDGVVKFEILEGEQRLFDYGVATPSNVKQIGGVVFANWTIRIGRERDT